MPGVVVYLSFTLMYGGIITHSFSTCKLHLKQSGKDPNQCCKLSLKSPAGEWIIRYLQYLQYLQLVGARKNGRARKRHFLARACSLFRPLLPSACYASYFFLNIFLDFPPPPPPTFFSIFFSTFFQLLSPLIA